MDPIGDTLFDLLPEEAGALGLPRIIIMLVFAGLSAY